MHQKKLKNIDEKKNTCAALDPTKSKDAARIMAASSTSLGRKSQKSAH
jgi:hypothetical protein